MAEEVTWVRRIAMPLTAPRIADAVRSVDPAWDRWYCDSEAIMVRPMIDAKGMRQRRLLAKVRGVIESITEGDLHAKRVLSISYATMGVIQGAALGVTAIGRAMAIARGVETKHAVKQVDRLLSNSAIDVWELFSLWVPYAIGAKPEIVVSLDWTDYDHDGQATLALNMITSHGRATPLMWLSVEKSELKGWRNAHEDRLLQRLREVVPDTVATTILADRGFGDTKLYALLWELKFDYVIRFRGVVKVTDEKGETRPAEGWVPPNGHTKTIRNAKVTHKKVHVPTIACTKAKGMKDSWCLAMGSSTRTGSEGVKLYGKRFTTEENFRDTKDIRFGMGLSQARINSPERRDRILLISALAVAMLTMLGAAGESIGLDRYLKVNTDKRRTHSLFFQGCHYYAAMPMMPNADFRALTVRFGELLREQQVTREVFALI